MMPAEPLELIAIVYRQDELAVIRSRLGAAGIWSFAHSEAQIGVNVGFTLALGGIRIFVHMDDAEAARSLLAQGEAWQRIGGVYDDSRAVDWLLALMLVLISGIAPPARIPATLVGVAATRTAD